MKKKAKVVIRKQKTKFFDKTYKYCIYIKRGKDYTPVDVSNTKKRAESIKKKLETTLKYSGYNVIK